MLAVGFCAKGRIMKRAIIAIAAVVFVWAGSAGIAVGKVVYVDGRASGADKWTCWADAYMFLQDGLADANESEKRVEVWVAQGIYRPDRSAAEPNGAGDREATFSLINGVALQGGYAGFGEADPNARDIELYETVLSGDLDENDIDVNDPVDLLDEPTRAENSYHVVIVSGTDETGVLVDGFTVTGGNANGAYPHNRGGGMYNIDSSPTVFNCTFTRNSAREYGGGMYSYWDSGLTLTNCNFSQNWAACGGGLCASRSSAMLANCSFSGNWREIGGGLSNNDRGNLTLTKCTFSGNSAKSKDGWEGYGGGMDNFMSDTALTNCTFSGNSAEYGGGMYCDVESDLRVTNCILWGNTAAQGNHIYLSDPHYMSTASISYSDIKGGIAEVFVGAGYTLNWAEGNIDADPCFADPNKGDYHLKSQAGRWDPNSQTWIIDANTTPCIDAGNPMTPIGCEPFPNGGIVNMGAYGGTAEASKSYFGEPPCEIVVAGDINRGCDVNFFDF